MTSRRAERKRALPTHRHGDNGSLVVPCVHGVLSSPVIQCVASEYNWYSRRRRGESEMHRLGEVGSLLNIGDFFKTKGNFVKKE